VGAADVVVWAYVQTDPAAEAAVIRHFRVAQPRHFHDWEHLCQCIGYGSKNRL
jgi:hypothetical protein